MTLTSVTLHAAIRQDADGYPPISSEAIPALAVGDDTYLLVGIPAFARRLGVGDLVEAHAKAPGKRLRITSITFRSPNWTVGLLVWNEPRDQEVIDQLTAFGCACERTPYRTLALSVPPMLDVDRVHATLDAGVASHTWDYDVLQPPM